MSLVTRESTSTASAAAHTVRPPVVRGESKSILVVFLELFFSRWMIIGGIFLTAAFWSYMTVARAPDTYLAKGQVLIKRGALQVVRNVPILRQQEELGSELDIILSIDVIDEVVDQLLASAQLGIEGTPPERKLIFGLYEPSRPRVRITLADFPVTDRARLQKFLRDQVRLQKFGESNVIELQVINTNPVFAAEVVNTVIDVYEKFNLTLEFTPGQAHFYETELRKVDSEINALQDELAVYKQRNAVADLEKERELLTLRRYQLLGLLDAVQVEKRAIEADLEVVSRPGGPFNASFLRNDASIAGMRRALFDQESKLAEILTTHTEDNPLVVAKREEVAALQDQLRREESLAIEQQQHSYRQILKKESELQAKIQEVNDSLVRYPVLEAQIDRYDRDIKQRTIKRADMVEQMFKSTTLERSDEALNKVKVLGYSEVPAFPREARRGFKFLVAIIFSLIVSFVIGAFVESLDHSVRRRDELEEHLGLPHLASLSAHHR